MGYSSSYFYGLVIELLHDNTVVRIWRPEQGFQLWPLESHHQIEVVDPFIIEVTE